MESSSSSQNLQKGGLITLPFIIANEAFERVASFGLLPNMILYLMKDYNMGVAKGTHILFLWSAATNFLPLIGAFVADSYLGKFLTIGLGSTSTLMGMVLLWLTTMVPQLKPPLCDQLNACKSSTPTQSSVLFFSFALISIGAGGIRPCSLAFGADQLYKKENLKLLESYFGWYYSSVTVSILIAFTGIVYIQDHLGWKVGFGIPAICMFLSTFLFLIASPLYIKIEPGTGLFTGFAQVIVASYKNRKLALPPLEAHRLYHHLKDGPDFIMPSNKVRFLNKACVISNHGQDINSDGSASNPWSLCTVSQVEDLKALVKVIPIWSSCIMMSISVSQGSFQLLQANSMDRHITSGFQIPAGSFGMFSMITLTIWIFLYDRAILPIASRLKGKPVKLSTKFRMGTGIFLSCICMLISGLVENIRRKRAIDQKIYNMSAMWLVPQYCLMGLAEAFSAIGQIEFYYSEIPKSMSSISSSLFGLGMAVASMLASLILSLVDDITSRGGKESWVTSNINKGHFDYYYWLLATMSFINFIYFMVCSKSYGPCVENITNVPNDVMKNLGEKEELCSRLLTRHEGENEVVQS